MIERISSNSFFVTVSNTDGEFIHSDGQTAPPIIQSILNRYNVQVADQMGVSIMVVVDFVSEEVIPERGEIIVMHETESGIAPVSTGVSLTQDELQSIVSEYSDDVSEVFAQEIADSIDVSPENEDYDDMRYEQDYM
jgi:hypothetical protein